MPDLLVTPDALPMYKANLGVFRGILQASIIATFALGAYSVVQLRSKLHGLAGIALGSIALLMGGSQAAFAWALQFDFQKHVAAQPLAVQFVEILLAVDLITHQPDHWPKNYGTVKFQPPESWAGQLMYPFRRHGEGTPYG